MLSCYNRGCGQKFDPKNNAEDSCINHPGEPFFHDAYKGWTCCNKKSVDFTEFLNIKGCTLSKHSNEKPPEAEKSKEEKFEEAEYTLKTPEPIPQSKPTTRPSFDSPLTTIEPIVAAAFKKQIDELPVEKSTMKEALKTGDHIPVGTLCKNGACNCSYESPATNSTDCVHHPGGPIFHEGMKYWSCCQKKTSDFAAFMSQVGCTIGSHKWIKEEADSQAVSCRWDWHQTATNVVVAIYAKLYHYAKSSVQVNPVRLAVCLVFSQQENAEFCLDLELRGIIDVAKTKVQMFGTKIEITLAKASPTSKWPKLDYPREVKEVDKSETESLNKQNIQGDSDSDIDLDDIEPMRGCSISEIQ